MKGSFLFLFFLSPLFFTSCTLSSGGYGGGTVTKPGSHIPIGPRIPVPPPTVGPYQPQIPGINSRDSTHYPFDLKIDTVAYMNCPGKIDPRGSLFFAFKFGSFFDGVQLSREFEKNTNNIPYSLDTSNFKNTTAQMAISPIGNPSRKLSIETGRLISSFQSPYLINNLKRKSRSLEVHPNLPITITLPLSGEHLPRITPLLGSGYAFTMTYNIYNSKNFSPIPLGQQGFYGRSYIPSFEGGESGIDYLKDIDEVYLPTNKEDGRWDCDDDLRVAIHRHPSLTQATFKNNRRYFDEKNLSAEGVCDTNSRAFSKSDLRLLEDILPSRHFNFGVSRVFDFGGSNSGKSTRQLCAVPKSPAHSCYAGKSDYIRIEFDPKKDCSLYDGNTKCPSFLSVCVRRK